VNEPTIPVCLTCNESPQGFVRVIRRGRPLDLCPKCKSILIWFYVVVLG
jgi:hypothetical protein